MILLKSLCSAFLMYSAIPVPRVEWREENRRYALCFFPLVGAVTGGVLMAWRYLCDLLGAGDMLFAAVACAIPIAVTGGIHLDGFCDVVDAQSSHAERPRKLEIMSDPHIGAFAAIWLGVYLLLQFGLFTQTRDVAVVAIGYALSRAMSGLAAVTFKSAKSGGTLQNFVRPAHRTATIVVLAVIIAASAAGMVAVSPVRGGAAVIAAAGTFLFYRVFAYRQFGGITGDLAGFFLQICELAVLAGAVAGGFVLSEV